MPPKSRTIAELVVREKEFNAKFKVSVQIKGQIIVAVTNLRDNNSFVQSIEGKKERNVIFYKALKLHYIHVKGFLISGQWLLAYCYSQPPCTLGLSNKGLRLYLDG